MKSVLIATGVFAPDIGGPASYANTLGTHLAARGIAVTVLTYSSVRTHEADARIPFQIVRVWKALPKGLRHAVYAARAVWLARNVDAILALNTVSAGQPAAWAARLWHKPLIVRLPGDAAWERAALTGITPLMIDDFQKAPKSGAIGRLHRRQVDTCTRAQAVIATSEYLAEIAKRWGIDPKKIHVIPNGVHFMPSPLSKEEARKKLGLGGLILLSVGRMVPWKGFRMLIKIMPQLAQANQLFRLVIVGDGPQMRTLQAMVRTMGLERKVSIVGRKSASELAEYFAAADMFVLNTGYESFAHQILEAMAAGVPVVTTSAGSNREIIRQGENGLLVKFNDEFGLVEAIKALAASPDIQEQLATEAKKTVVHFSSRRMLDSTETLLQEVSTKRE